MAWVFIVVLFFVVAPLARALAHRIERQGLPASRSEEEVKQLLQQAEQRLAASETRLAALEERVDFYERLLRNPERKA